MNRRDMLMLTGSLAMGLKAAPEAVAMAELPPNFAGPHIDLTTPKGNVNAAVRLDANLDESRHKWGSVSGVVCGVRDGEPLRDLFGFEVVSVAKAWAQGDGSYRVPHREAIFYTDLKTGDILRSWYNPYIDEEVEVVDVINDPWNHFFAEQVKRFEPDYGGCRQRHGAEPSAHQPLLQGRAAARQVAEGKFRSDEPGQRVLYRHREAGRSAEPGSDVGAPGRLLASGDPLATLDAHGAGARAHRLSLDLSLFRYP